MNDKNKQKNVDAQPIEAQPEKKSVCFYPDIEYNKRERRRAIVLSGLLLIFLAGMGISIIVASLQNTENPSGWISGLLLLILFVMAVSMIPGAFKQYPVKKEPIIEVKPKEVVVFGETLKFSDIKDVRLTITLAPVGNKEEN